MCGAREPTPRAVRRYRICGRRPPRRPPRSPPLTPPPPSSPPLNRAFWAVVALVLAEHLGWAALDGRLPRDPGLYYQQVPALFRWLHGAPLRPEAGLWRPGAWMELLIALLMRPLGPGAGPMRALDALWVAGVVAGAAAAGRALGGARGALAAAALTAALPVVVITGRTSWIHLPEAALTLGGLAILLSDPMLSRIRAACGLGLLLGLALALRPSGLVWAGSLLPLATWGLWRGEGRRWSRILAFVLPILLACPLALGHLGGYLAGKAAARERYATWLPGLPAQILSDLGIALAPLLLGLLALPRLRGVARGPLLTLLSWPLLALLLGLGSRAGLDNFPLGFVGLAVLAAAAAVARWPRAGLGAALGALILSTLLPWLPAPISGRAPPGLELLESARPLAFFRPFRAYDAARVRALLDEVCPGGAPRSCRVLVDQGLYLPYGEEPGALELFLAREERVTLLSAAASARRLRAPPDALVRWDCGPGAETAWNARYPAAARGLELNLLPGAAPLWQADLGGGCAVRWWRGRQGA